MAVAYWRQRSKSRSRCRRREARAGSDDERAAIRAEIYKAGARKTVRVFDTLTSLIEGTLRGTLL